MTVAVTRKRNPLLERYLESLILNPILTKAVTSAVLNFVQENLAQYLAGAKPAPYKKTGILPVDAAKANKKAFKLAAYGFFISAPLGHTLMSILQKMFAGKTSPRARIAMILVSNLVLAPIQNSVYLASLAVINGATSVPAKFLPQETWVPFFSLVTFVLGTYVNTKVKKQQVAAKAKAEAKKDAEDKSA